MIAASPKMSEIEKQAKSSHVPSTVVEAIGHQLQFRLTRKGELDRLVSFYSGI